MSQDTQPLFILSSGRSGTQLWERVFAEVPGIEMNHEYLCTHIQPVAAKYMMGHASLDDVVETVRMLHGRAVAMSSARVWGDSSNKLSWIVPALEAVFPNAKYVYLVRDGRKVVSSFFHKLGDECYDDWSTAALARWHAAPDTVPEPPPEKRYWWMQPPVGSDKAVAFAEFDQFQRICYHWGEVNRVLLRDLAPIPDARKRQFRLEDLVADEAKARDLLDFVGVPFSDDLFDVIRRPHNVNVPKNFYLTDEQRAQLFAEAGDVMARFGYDATEEYTVRYGD